MLKVKRRFNTIYWTDLRSCWKRDKPCGDSDRRSDSHADNTVCQLASYASFEPVVAGDAHKRLIGRVDLHPCQNPHPAFMRNSRPTQTQEFATQGNRFKPLGSMQGTGLQSLV